MYFVLKIFNPDTDMYGYDYVVTENVGNDWELVGNYASNIVEMCGCPVESIAICTREQINYVMEKTERICDYNEYGINVKQHYTGDTWFKEV